MNRQQLAHILRSACVVTRSRPHSGSCRRFMLQTASTPRACTPTPPLCHWADGTGWSAGTWNPQSPRSHASSTRMTSPSPSSRPGAPKTSHSFRRCYVGISSTWPPFDEWRRCSHQPPTLGSASGSCPGCRPTAAPTHLVRERQSEGGQFTREATHESPTITRQRAPGLRHDVR